jgi:hypothetical protein
MPHRTVFQIGKEHAHPFTVFIGGFVIGALVAGAIVWAWSMADDTNVEPENAVVNKEKQASPKASPSVKPSFSPTSSPAVTF